jgi:hypothetical protein
MGGIHIIHVHGELYLSDPDASSYVQYWESHVWMRYLNGKNVIPYFLEQLSYGVLLCMLQVIVVVV